MREALARSDHDFVLSEPRARRASPRPKRFATLRAVLRFGFRLAAYPNHIAGALVFALALAIMVNALLLQRSRHPAPLFHTTFHFAPAPAAKDKPRPAASAPASPPLRDPIGQLIKSETGAVGQSNASAARAGAAAAAPPRVIHQHAADPISQLLAVHPIQPKRPEAPKRAEDPKPQEQPSKTVFGVQQALVKLGFVLRADGRMGTITKRALEEYEHDRGLPTGTELTQRLIHRLSAESGLRIE